MTRSSKPVQERASAPPESYTPRHLAQKILASRDALEGERKQVTVLFADITGSTTLIQDLDPEDARTLLEPAVSAMIEAVHRFEGTVCRVMGDGIMALFGAPLAHEDHAARACYAALTMQEGIRRYGDEVRERDGIHVLARVGLNSGEVVVGSVSNDLHVEYSAIGATTHLAARMEQLAVPGTIQLTAETLRLAEGLVEVRSIGRIPVKGVAESVIAFELIGAGLSRRRFQSAAAHGLTPFVGRQTELEALQRALDLALVGKGQIVAPVGEPGVGKSRLLYEFVHSHRTRDWLLLESGSVSYGKATLWLPVVDLLKSYCRIEPRDDARTVREKLTGKLLALDPALAAILPPLLSLLDLPAEDEVWAALDPAGRRRVTLDALRRLLLRESQEQPLLLVFEDLHWIDSETQALLDTLVEALPTARILLLVNYRPEYTHSWGNKSYYTQLRIDPLELASAEALLDVLLGDPSASSGAAPSVARGQAALQPLKSLLVARTEGNPFFLEESVRSLVETGALAGERGAYRLTKPVEEVRVPSTVQVVLAARIDRLPAAEKRLLQTAAVIGKDVPFALLQRIAETPDADLQAGLAQLQSGELLYAVSLFPELEYTFKHALTHEVAYGSQLQERRRTLHAEIVAAIERLYPDRLAEQVERLAQHAARGQLWEKAVTYARQAGQRALARSAVREAVEHFEGALAALAHLPDTIEVAALGIDIRFELRTAYWMISEYERAQEYVRQAEAIARAIGDQRRLGWALVYQTYYLRMRVDHQEAVETGEHAIAVAQALGDLSMQIATTDVTAASYHEMGQLQRGIELTRANIAAVEGPLSQERLGQHQAPSVSSRTTLAYCLSWQGNFTEAIEQAEAGIQIADAINHPTTILIANCGAGLAYMVKGEASKAVARLEHVLAIGRSIGFETPNFGHAAFAGHAYTLAGRVDEAVSLLEHSRAQVLKNQHRPCASLWAGWLADAYLLADRLSDAERAATDALDLARANREYGFEGYALRLLAEVATRDHASDGKKAEDLFQRALAVGEELGMRPLQARCHLDLGKLLRKTDRRDEARAELLTAVAMLREMEMTFWLPEAEKELALVHGACSQSRL